MASLEKNNTNPVKGCKEFLPCVTYSDHLTKNYWCALMIIGIMMYIFIFYIIDSLGETVMKIQYMCLAKCKTDTCRSITTNFRDSSYFMTADSNPQDCWFTMWELSHMMTHAFIGYFFNIQTSLGVGVGFEIFEHYAYDCGSVLDVLWNTVGFSIGYSARYFLQKKSK